MGKLAYCREPIFSQSEVKLYNMYNVCKLCKGVFMHLQLLDCFKDSTLILVHLLVLVLLESGTSNQVCKNISNKNSFCYSL